MSFETLADAPDGVKRLRDQLRRHPEAAAGHALDHFLEFGPPRRALTLAEANVAARPNAESHMKLAQARLAVGDVDGAVAAIEGSLATVWRTAELHDVAARVYDAAGPPGAAAAQRHAAAQMRE